MMTLSYAHRMEVYLLELRQNLTQLQAASFLHRNPYLHSYKARQHIKAFTESMQHCLDTWLLFSGAICKEQSLDEKTLQGYHALCQILFEYQDGVRKQEIIHLLLLRDSETTQRLLRFVTGMQQLIHLMKHT